MGTMLDSVTATDIPTSAGIVGGYINGRYQWLKTGWDRFPTAVKVPIAVYIPGVTVNPVNDVGEQLTQVEALARPGSTVVLDVEEEYLAGSERTNAVRYATQWCGLIRKAGYSPTIYTSESTASVIPAGFGDDWWLGHYLASGAAHLVTFDGKQVSTQYASPLQIPGHPHYDLTETVAGWPREGAVPSEPVQVSDAFPGYIAYGLGLLPAPPDAAVLAFQQRINASGIYVLDDGRDGPATTAALKEFQGRHREDGSGSAAESASPLLATDGVGGPLTWAALVAATPGA